MFAARPRPPFPSSTLHPELELPVASTSTLPSISQLPTLADGIPSESTSITSDHGPCQAQQEEAAVPAGGVAVAMEGVELVPAATRVNAGRRGRKLARTASTSSRVSTTSANRSHPEITLDSDSGDEDHNDLIIIAPNSSSRDSSPSRSQSKPTSQARRTKRTRRSDTIVIPDSPPPPPKKKKLVPSFLPLSELYNNKRTGPKGKTAQAAAPRWPTKEEHGGEPPKLERRESWRARWNGSHRGSSKGKEKEDDTDDFFAPLLDLYGSYASSEDFPPATMRNPPQLVHQPLANLLLLPPPHPPHPLLSRLAAPFFAVPPDPAKFTRKLSAVEVTPNPSWRQMWTSTYAPRAADEVLGTTSGQSALALKEWLSELALWKDTDVFTKRRAVVRGAPRPQKKRRRGVVSDEETWLVNDEEEDEVDFETADSANGDADDADDGGGLSFVPRGAAARKNLFPFLSNLVLLCGPNGSGKTSTVQACATELGFEIFEVYPGIGKRSAKDVERYVGDVSKNHIVHGASMSPKKDPFASFFRKREAGGSASSSAPASALGGDAGKGVGGTQSLILFEEVDILYGEEKDFWSGLISLAQHSRRPVIMTCTDATLVPFSDLGVQTIVLDGVISGYLPFKAPEPAIAVPFLQLVTLSEGHILSPDSLAKLYTVDSLPASEAASTAGIASALPHPNIVLLGQDPDLRRVLTQLQFECQWALGETNGGIDWMLSDFTPEERANQTAWSAGAFPKMNEGVPSQVERKLPSLEDWVRGSDALSFTDAYLARRPHVQQELDEAGIPIDPTSVVLGPTQLPPLPTEHRLQLALHGREDEFVAATHDLTKSLLPSGPGAEMPCALIESKQCQAVDAAYRILLNLVLPPAPILPHPCAFVEYLPVARLITDADILHASITDSEELFAYGGARRSKRLAGRTFEPKLAWTAEQAVLVRNSAFPE